MIQNKILYTLQKCLDPFFTLKKNKTCNCLYRLIRDRPFNLQGGLWVFLSLRIFPQINIRLYDKNSKSDYFYFPPPKSEYFFQQQWESEYFFRKKP